MSTGKIVVGYLILGCAVIAIMVAVAAYRHDYTKTSDAQEQATPNVSTENTDFVPNITPQVAFRLYVEAIQASDGLEEAQETARKAMIKAGVAKNGAVEDMGIARALILAACREACQSDEPGAIAFAATRQKLAESKQAVEDAKAAALLDHQLDEAFFAAKAAHEAAQKKISDTRVTLWKIVQRDAVRGEEGEMFRQTEVGFVEATRNANLENVEVVGACDKYDEALLKAIEAGTEFAKLVPDANSVPNDLDNQRYDRFIKFDTQARLVLEKDANDVTEEEYAKLKETGKLFSEVLDKVDACKSARDRYFKTREELDKCLLAVIQLSK